VGTVLGAGTLLPAGSAVAAGAEVSLSGTYTVLHVDPPRRSAEVHADGTRHRHPGKPRFVTTLDTGSTSVPLELEAGQAAPVPGSEVEITGTRLANGTVAVDTLETTAPAESTLAAGPASDPHTVLVLLAYWTSTPGGLTSTAVRDEVLGRTAPFLQSSSYGAVTLTGDVTEPTKVPAPASCNDYGAVTAAAEAEAARQGYNPDAYTNIMTVWPETSLCPWAGLGQVGGRYSWINGQVGYGIATHELGHNLGLYHSNALLCEDSAGRPTTYSSSCQHQEYADPHDVMGSAYANEDFNAGQKALLGWLAGRSSAPRSSGSALLAPLEASASGLQGLHLDAPTGDYWLEHRRNSSGVLVHLDSRVDRRFDGTRLLDLTPGSSEWDLDDAFLTAGRTWTHPSRDFFVRVDSVTAEGARVTWSWIGPTVSVPAPRLVTGSTFTSGTTATDITWTVSDPSGVCAQSLERRDTTATATTVPASARSSRTTVKVGVPSYFRLLATDCRNTQTRSGSGAAIAVAASETGSGVAYRGVWTAGTASTADGGRFRSTTSGGALARYTFTGRSVGWVSARAPGQGQARVYVDGVYAGVVDTGATTLTPRQMVWSRSWPTTATRVVDIVAVGTPGRPRVQVDAWVHLR